MFFFISTPKFFQPTIAITYLSNANSSNSRLLLTEKVFLLNFAQPAYEYKRPNKIIYFA